MSKKLSIETIKKNLVDKISNNVEVLSYFKENSAVKERGIDLLKEYLIVGHGITRLFSDDFISIEVSESEHCSANQINKIYNVAISIGLRNEDDLDSLSSLIGKIASEIYPDRYNYCNEPRLIELDSDGFYKDGKLLIRAVSFTIE